MSAGTDEAFLESLCDEVDGVYRKYHEGGIGREEEGVRVALQQTQSILTTLRPRATGPAAALRATVAVAQVKDLLEPPPVSPAVEAPVAPPAASPPAAPAPLIESAPTSQPAAPPASRWAELSAPAPAPPRPKPPVTPPAAPRPSRALVAVAVAALLALAFIALIAFSSTGISHEPVKAPSRPPASHVSPAPVRR